MDFFAKGIAGSQLGREIDHFVWVIETTDRIGQWRDAGESGDLVGMQQRRQGQNNETMAYIWPSI